MKVEYNDTQLTDEDGLDNAEGHGGEDGRHGHHGRHGGHGGGDHCSGAPHCPRSPRHRTPRSCCGSPAWHHGLEEAWAETTERGENGE